MLPPGPRRVPLGWAIFFSREARISQQVPHESAHTSCRAHDEVEKQICLGVQLSLVFVLKKLRVGAHRAQRLLQVVARDVRKLLQGGIGFGQRILQLLARRLVAHDLRVGSALEDFYRGPAFPSSQECLG